MHTQTSPIYTIGWYPKSNKYHIINPPGTTRRLGTYEDHIKSIKRYCKSQAVIYDNTNVRGGTIINKPNSCNSWDCPECRKKKASVLKSRITAGIKKQNWRLLTVTVDPKKVSLSDSLATCSRLWDVFSKRLKRVYPDVKYIKVLEFQKSGYPHYHVILNKFLFKPWIKRNWTDLGGGYIVDIKKIKSTNIARYVAGYLSGKDEKHHERDYQFYNNHLRRFSFSRNFDIKPWRKTTIVFTHGIDFDDSLTLWSDVLRLVYRTGTFFAVKKDNEIKYINLHGNSTKYLEC